MYPNKSMFDYMNEMNRLFPRTSDNDMFQSPTTPPNTSFPSLFNQSSINQSSSSTDSTSPDSFPDFPSHRPELLDTPYIVRRQRPIIGRKIFDKTPPTDPRPKDHGIEFPSTIWKSDDQLFPSTPPTSNLFVEPKNYSQNVFYELFPRDGKGYEFRTPVRANTPSNTMSVNSSPRQPDRFPSMENFGNPRFPKPIFTDPQPASTSRQQYGVKMCTFCRKNGETPLVYMTHTVKEKIGNRSIVSCPILRSHMCSVCGSSGDNAHTITYCPILKSSNNGQPLQSTTITLKNTRIKSNGRRRY